MTFNRNMRDLLRIVPQYRLASIVLNTCVHIISSPGGKYLVCLSVSTKFSCQTKSCIFLIIFLVSPGTEALISCSMFCPEHPEQFCKHIPHLDNPFPSFPLFSAEVLTTWLNILALVFICGQGLLQLMSQIVCVFLEDLNR